jgi:enoyl-CoA hydratase
MDKLIDYESHHGIAHITLHNPPANAYSYEMMQQLDAAVLAARMDSKVHVLLLSGQGDKFFCAGADITMLKDMSPTFKYAFCLHANETMLRLENTPKLVIAALNGHTVGGGLEVALAADIRIGKTQGGKVGLPEVHLGVLPGTGGTQRLTRLIGKSRAIEMMATGDTIDFEGAHTLGLINKLLPAENFIDHAIDYAKGFVPPQKASKAVGLIKRAVQSGADMSLSDGLALERELQQQLFMSHDAQEGIRSYVEKEKPVFQGK